MCNPTLMTTLSGRVATSCDLLWPVIHICRLLDVANRDDLHPPSSSLLKRLLQALVVSKLESRRNPAQLQGSYRKAINEMSQGHTREHKRILHAVRFTYTIKILLRLPWEVLL
jgi:hypothetical protein